MIILKDRNYSAYYHNIKLLQNISTHLKITQQNTNSRGKYEIERIV